MRGKHRHTLARNPAMLRFGAKGVSPQRVIKGALPRIVRDRPNRLQHEGRLRRPDQETAGPGGLAPHAQRPETVAEVGHVTRTEVVEPEHVGELALKIRRWASRALEHPVVLVVDGAQSGPSVERAARFG